jgi:hypothetical protein
LTLEETLARAEKSLFTVWHAFHGEIVSVGPRTQPLLAYVGLGLEHVDSIIILMKHGNVGSALALYRPVIEILWRGSWTAACATDEQVQAMRKDDFRFPDSVTLVKDLDKALGTEEFFHGLHKQTWKALNSYTHAGMLQLASRYSKGELTPEYREDEKISAINSSLIATALLVSLVLRMHNRQIDAATVDTMLAAFIQTTPGVDEQTS